MASRNVLDAIFDFKKEGELSHLFDLSQIQESFSFRAQRRSLLLAQFLIDDQGELKQQEVSDVLKALKEEGQFYYSEGSFDGLLLAQHIKVLTRLKDDPFFYKNIRKFQKPLCHKGAEALIGETLNVSTPIKEKEIRQAVLSACLTLLRQNVGSCFATAPAILIHQEQLDNLLKDLNELFFTGKLKRTFGGIEHTVPLSPSSGLGDLKKVFFWSDFPVHLFLSPGLMAAFETSQPKDLEKILTAYLKSKRQSSAEELIREVFLNQMGLKKSDLKEISLKRVPSIFSGSSNLRDKVEQFFQKEKEAHKSFKSFTDNALLKAWEFTLASFSEVKMEFSKWNLYASLGFRADEKEGLGEIFYRYLQNKLDESNQKMQEAEKEYNLAFDQLRATEVLLRTASSESEVRRLRAEHQSRYYNMQSYLNLRNEIYNQSAHYSNFFNFLVEQYSEKFPEYFQEIYDAEMLDFKGSQYEDSPAGFRLIYKYGRSDASVWRLIRDADQWIDMLVDFFRAVESQITAQCESEKAKDDISHLTTEVIRHIRTKPFLENAILRMGKAHSKVISNIDDIEKIEKKPWAYTSGGSMDLLVNTYYKREGKLTSEGRPIESVMDLLIFLLDTLKALPPLVTNPFLKNPGKGMLMQSPSHAFILHPGWELFREGWEDNGFTYTWVRDVFLGPREDFFNRILLSPYEQNFLVERLCLHLPVLVAHECRKNFNRISSHLTLIEFRNQMAQSFSNTSVLDSILYESLPLTSQSDVLEKLRALLPREYVREVILEGEFFEDAPYLTRHEIEGLAKKQLTRANPPLDVWEFISKRSAEIQLAPPPPLRFADTNWSGFHFAFLVNPGSGALELWRMDRTGSTGFPMSTWKPFIDGSTRIPWVVYTHPYEYFS